METIIIYGMRGTGKSTIGKIVADKLGYIFIDLDKFIENEVGLKLSEYIDLNGWDDFRNIEHECLKKVLSSNGRKVVSLGGGTIVFYRNINVINSEENKRLIFLETDINIIANRIKNDEVNNLKRNSLTGENVIKELNEVYKKREIIYKNNADFLVKNNGKIEFPVNKIIDIINKSKICIPITNFDKGFLDKIFKKIHNIDKIGYIELRIDFLDNFKKLKKIVEICPKKVIVTNRIKQEGGQYELNNDDNLFIHKKALEYGSDLVDIELQTLEKLKNHEIDFNKVIISFHNFDNTPTLDELVKILNKMKRFNPAVYKIAVSPKKQIDVDIIYKLVNYFKNYFIGKDYIFISMGELGMQTRIDLYKDGGLLTYASIGGINSAPGQFDYNDL